MFGVRRLVIAACCKTSWESLRWGRGRNVSLVAKLQFTPNKLEKTSWVKLSGGFSAVAQVQKKQVPGTGPALL